MTTPRELEHLSKLTKPEIETLLFIIFTQPQSWRSAITKFWMTGKEQHFSVTLASRTVECLQSIRNKIGPSGLYLLNKRCLQAYNETI